MANTKGLILTTYIHRYDPPSTPPPANKASLGDYFSGTMMVTNLVKKAGYFLKGMALFHHVH